LGAAKDGEPHYVVVHCTGYIKAWPPAGNGLAEAFGRGRFVRACGLKLSIP